MTIRRQPSDFVVRELPDPALADALRPAPAREAPHAVYELTKTSLTTPEAIQRLGRALGVRHAAVDYAGLKDKHAQTAQLVSIPVPAEERAGVPREAGGPRWSAALRGWSPTPVSAGWIARNRFTIVVRDLSRAAADEMDRRAAAVALPTPGLVPERTLLFVNYFGDQRFGSARHGKGFIAAHLVRGDFEAALRLAIATPARKDAGARRRFTRAAAAKWGDWRGMLGDLPRMPERKAVERLAEGAGFRDAFAALPYFAQSIAVEAYQSHLWNATARRLARRLAGEGALVRADDPFGEMLFPPAGAVREPWRSLIVPMLSPRTALAEPWGPDAARALAEEGLTPDRLGVPGLRRPSFDESPRPLFAAAERFTMTEAEPDDLTPRRLKRTLRFELPRGAYATVLLRALGQ